MRFRGLFLIISFRMRIGNTLLREMAVHGDAEELSYYLFLKEHGKNDIVEHHKGTSFICS